MQDLIYSKAQLLFLGITNEAKAIETVFVYHNKL